MEFATDLALQRGVDKLMLTHTRQACKRTRDDSRAIMVPVSGQIVDGDLGVGKGLRQMGVQRFNGHGHAGVSWFLRRDSAS